MRETIKVNNVDVPVEELVNLGWTPPSAPRKIRTAKATTIRFGKVYARASKSGAIRIGNGVDPSLDGNTYGLSLAHWPSDTYEQQVESYVNAVRDLFETFRTNTPVGNVEVVDYHG